MSINIQQVFDAVKSFDSVVMGLTKSAFVPSAPPQGGAPMPPQGGAPMPPVDPNTGAPMDPSMAGGMPPQGGAPMPPVDPNTGAPMDPSMMGGMPPQGGAPMPPQGGAPMPPMDPNTGAPMDPSMAGGMPPQGSNAPLPEDLMNKLQELAGSTGAMAENFDALQKQTDQLGEQQLSLAERLDKLEAMLNGPAPYEGSSTPANKASEASLEGKDLPLR